MLKKINKCFVRIFSLMRGFKMILFKMIHDSRTKSTVLIISFISTFSYVVLLVNI